MYDLELPVTVGRPPHTFSNYICSAMLSEDIPCRKHEAAGSLYRAVLSVLYVAAFIIR